MGRVVKNDPVVSVSRLSTKNVGDNEKIGSEFAESFVQAWRIRGPQECKRRRRRIV